MHSLFGIQPLYSLAGVLVGLLVGLTGVGGGSLMTPILVLAFGFHPTTAVGTDLLYASCSKTAGTAVHGWRGTVDWKVVGRLASGSVPATLLTLAVLTLVNAKAPGSGTGTIVSIVLGVVLMLTGIAILFRRQVVAWLGPHFEAVEERRIARFTIALGALLGILVTLTSVGAGALGMTALLVIYPRLPVARLVGSDIAHAVPLTLIAGLGHLSMGTVDLQLLVSLLVGSVPGIVAGSLIATGLSERILVPILAITLVIVGIRLLG